MIRNTLGSDRPLVLAVDAGSPVVSVALARAGEVLIEKHIDKGTSSLRLIRLVDAVLSEVGSCVGDLGGVVALRGPGSFTGLRVGLATCMGLHQALGIAATTLTTFETLASIAPDRDRIVVAAVESIREQWLVQTFRSDVVPEALDEPQSISKEELANRSVDLLVGFGLGAVSDCQPRAFASKVLEPPPLAAPASILRHKCQQPWDPAGLIQPLYLQQPAVTRAPGPPIDRAGLRTDPSNRDG